MSLEPAHKKAKMAVEGSAGETSSHEDSTRSREKAWHESKDLRKRAAFLLDSLDIVPPDVTFHIGSETGNEVTVVRGHKQVFETPGTLYFIRNRIFFALSSPVFQAMWYGKGRHVDEGDVKIPDVTVDAFGCLKEYAYTDSFKFVNDNNVMDVLFASKKYLMSKLSRYCYEYIQNRVSADNAVAFWMQARQISDEIVEHQSAAEIKRNTAKIVSTSDFLRLTHRDLLELTSWNDLSIQEVDLYEAMKKWKTHQEKEGRSSIIFNRTSGGLFQHVRFALFTPGLIATDQAKAETAFLSLEDIQELYLYQFAGKNLTTFNPNSRVPALSSYQLTFKYFVSKAQNYVSADVNMDWQFFGSFSVIIWPDVAPKACQVLRQYVEKEHCFFLLRTTFPQQKSDEASVSGRKKSGVPSVASNAPTSFTEEAETIERKSPLWSAPGTVCLRFVDNSASMPVLTVLNKNLTKLNGYPPEIRFHGRSTNHGYGVAIGKILDGPMDSIDKLSCLDHFAKTNCGMKKENNPQMRNNYFRYRIRFECDLVKENTG